MPSYLEGLWFETSLGKVHEPLSKSAEQIRLEMWLKWQSIYFASTKSRLNPTPTKTNKQTNKKQ
jgi:hypothetical protein